MMHVKQLKKKKKKKKKKKNYLKFFCYIKSAHWNGTVLME